MELKNCTAYSGAKSWVCWAAHSCSILKRSSCTRNRACDLTPEGNFLSKSAIAKANRVSSSSWKETLATLRWSMASSLFVKASSPHRLIVKSSSPHRLFVKSSSLHRLFLPGFVLVGVRVSGGDDALGAGNSLEQAGWELEKTGGSSGSHGLVLLLEGPDGEGSRWLLLEQADEGTPLDRPLQS